MVSTVPYPVALSTDTVFIHSLVSFRLVSMKTILNNSIELTVGFRVVNSTQFALQLKAKYPIGIDTLNDGSVRVFIYNKLDFQAMYIRMDYQILTFSNLSPTVTQINQVYTTLSNSSNPNSILFGINGI